MKHLKRAFTIVELVIVMAIIAILAAVIIPSLANGANNAKQDIIDIYNGQTVKMIDNDTGEILYEGKEQTTIDGYSLVNVEVKDGIVIMYMSNELKKGDKKTDSQKVINIIEVNYENKNFI